ncbi:nitrile hydratase accessory protein [Mesorhizobium sp. B3-1-9]|uniref:nitrile hydratase accessory protein n=1 Tax=unclassified Mesorhizobium TaxID=325217 RepID=UPI001125D064|nr:MULTISPECIES: nitrile hydratase accessory protein [unclassified Mesorhizobium]TPI39844.1 nitrile hydratase accessory protein [Mesorhizobium sp. B3-1-9]TPJ29532.1 nitrile hydratase accessory protein [Mesorhizobium sp. B2-8-3]
MSRHDAALPADFGEPVFAEPWQAEAFAMTVALHDKGLFSWSEWAEALSAEVKQPGAASDGHDYYEHWLAALEKLLSRKGIVREGGVDELAAAWERAAHATPHGKPILLENDPGF